MIDTDILIVGGGLAGLSLAERLHVEGINFHLLEARELFGGRIKVLQHDNVDFDLGPSWFWPGQPHMAALASRLGLTVFEQYASGASSYEDEQGRISRSRGLASMQGALRIDGGMISIISGLLKALPEERLTLNQTVSKIARNGDKIDISDAEGNLVATAKNVIIAMPLRIASNLSFKPVLDEAAIIAMQKIPTWMAGHAKFVAVYDKPFWREAGLSGDAMSRRGPMVEMHDATDLRSTYGALFGFLGIPAQVRNAHRRDVEQACIDQMGRVFEAGTCKPIAYELQDWAFEPHTAVQADHISPAGHPHYGLPQALSNMWDGQLMFSSTETAQQFGGFLEGALEAADATFKKIIAGLSANLD